MYQELMKPGGFLAVPENTGLFLCSDGVDLFKCSQQPFWLILVGRSWEMGRHIVDSHQIQ